MNHKPYCALGLLLSFVGWAKRFFVLPTMTRCPELAEGWYEWVGNKKKLPTLPCLLLSVLSGCSAVTTAPDFYLLAPTPALPTAALHCNVAPCVIALQTAQLPKYLGSTWIVTRRDAQQLDVASAHRWAEPLQDNFTRVLADNLAQRLGVARVFLYPRQAPEQVDFIISVAVDEFLGAPAQQVTLRAYWSARTPASGVLSLPKGRTTPHHGTADIQIPVAGGPDFPALVNAMSAATGLLADQIAAEMTGK